MGWQGSTVVVESIEETVEIAGTVTVGEIVAGTVDITGPVTVDNVAGTQLATATEQVTVVSNHNVGANTFLDIALDTLTYPTGLGAANFHSATLALSVPLVAGQAVEVWLSDQNGFQLFTQTIYPGQSTAVLPLCFGTLNSSVAIFVYNLSSVAQTFDIIFDQEPSTPGVLLAAIAQGLIIPVGGNQPGVAIDTDSSGRLVPIPDVGSAEADQALGTANGNFQFGPTTAQTATRCKLSVAIPSMTTPAAGTLRVEIRVGSAAGVIIDELVLAYAAATSAVSLAGPAAVLAFPLPATAGGDLYIVWTFSSVPTANSGSVSAIVGYR
jgi:hypothetical protein